MRDIFSCMLGDKTDKNIEFVPLPNSTTSRRIKDMASECESVLVDRLKGSPVDFTTQLDESADVAGLTNLVFVRYLFEECVHDDMLLCQPIETSTKGQDLLQIFDAFMPKKNLS